MIFYISLALSFFLVLLEFKSTRANKKVYITKIQSSKWHFIYRWRWIIGIVFVFISFFISYSIPWYENINRVIGFPLIVAVFDNEGRDYTSFMGTVFFILNAMIWYYLVQIILYLWAKYFCRNI